MIPSDTSPPPAPLRLRLRRIWLLAHGWLGLSFGAVMALFGLTGALLVFVAPLLRWEIGDALFVAPPSSAVQGLDPARLDAYLAAARAANPAITSLDGLYAPHTTPVPGTAPLVLAHLDDPSGAQHHYVIPLDPVAATAAPGFIFETTWAGRLLMLHIGLVPWGFTLVSAAGLVLVLSSVTGLLLWWPMKHRWRSALPPAADAAPRPRWLAWHNFAGIWLLVPTLVVTLTGVWMMQPAWLDPVADTLAPLAPEPDHDAFTARIAVRPSPDLPVNQLAAAALAAHPGHVLMSLSAPHEPGDPAIASLLPVTAREPRREGTRVWLHPGTGEILQTRREIDFNAADVTKAWLRPVHADLGLGLPGSVIVFLTGISLPALYVTGAWLWWRRIRPKRPAV
jgi:uncharacterized iron-regulated membrane protein